MKPVNVTLSGHAAAFEGVSCVTLNGGEPYYRGSDILTLRWLAKMFFRVLWKRAVKVVRR